MTGPANKADRLEATAIIAPVIRENADWARLRRVSVVDRDGNVIRHVSLLEVREALCLAQKLEFEVDDGHRPSRIICKVCGSLSAATNRSGCVASRCEQCRLSGERIHPKVPVPCADCGALAEMSARNLKKVAGAPYRRCSSCAQKSRTRESEQQRADSIRKAWAHRRAKPCG